MRKEIKCPKCREVGSGYDCYDELIVRLNDRNTDADLTEDDYVLEVTLKFDMPWSSSLPLSPQEMATHVLEELGSDPATLQKAVQVISESEDFDLEVRPVFG